MQFGFRDACNQSFYGHVDALSLVVCAMRQRPEYTAGAPCGSLESDMKTAQENLLHRRSFLACCAAAGVSSPLFSSALWSQTKGGQDVVSLEAVDHAARLAGLSFTMADREQMLDRLRANLVSYEGLRALKNRSERRAAFCTSIQRYPGSVSKRSAESRDSLRLPPKHAPTTSTRLRFGRWRGSVSCSPHASSALLSSQSCISIAYAAMTVGCAASLP